ncbi:anthranilate synthase family protein [Actinomadura fibrosa]|uniref:anthranilate synthase n=1 Tax=Actinomadura fibrosa TaxID=111802 RepID=A0ABW2XVV9_9ACTN|nr:anthranilate synthase family protein [Actinomadura fibrosa]
MPDPDDSENSHFLAEELLRRVLRIPGRPFALLYRRDAGAGLEILLGEFQETDRLERLETLVGIGGREVLALVPYRQITERGFACVDDGEPLLAMPVRERAALDLGRALDLLPREPIALTGAGFDLGDDAYGAIVDRVIREEIGRGAGSNFVIKRTYTAAIAGYTVRHALALFARLLVGEPSAYWTFLVHTGDRTFVGATPERHVSLEGGVATMNPISGTYRYPAAGPSLDGLLEFLADRKETEELYMVVDEELKMMARVCDRGGQVEGPHVREMARLAHTEYLVRGRTRLTGPAVLRETMFAPTVTGSPLENACRVVARYEPTGRRYYSGVVALFGRGPDGGPAMDSAIVIRTADIDRRGTLRLDVGATLVRTSAAAGEAAETWTKAAGVLDALGANPQNPTEPDEQNPADADTRNPARAQNPAGAGAGGRTEADAQNPAGAGARRPVSAGALGSVSVGPDSIAGGAAGAKPGSLGGDPRVQAALTARNATLSGFWLSRERGEPVLPGLRVLVVDAEDAFTAMLGLQLEALGPEVTILPWDAPVDVEDFGLVVVGPGPGDPRDTGDPRISRLRALCARLLRPGGPPLLAECLGHQLVASLLGLELREQAAPSQGLQERIDLFGEPRRVGFYNTYSAVSGTDLVPGPDGRGPLSVCRDAATGRVHAVRGRGLASVQFHVESLLTERGEEILRDLLAWTLNPQPVR